MNIRGDSRASLRTFDIWFPQVVPVGWCHLCIVFREIPSYLGFNYWYELIPIVIEIQVPKIIHRGMASNGDHDSARNSHMIHTDIICPKKAVGWEVSTIRVVADYTPVDIGQRRESREGRRGSFADDHLQCPSHESAAIIERNCIWLFHTMNGNSKSTKKYLFWNYKKNFQV
jgi:hypothetical protein